MYESVASATLPPMARDGVRRALPALRTLEEAPQGTRLVWASAASGDYPVFFGRGLVAAGFVHPSGQRRFVVTDENVAALHTVEADAQCVIPAGEAEKTLARAEEVLRFLAASGAARDDLIVAVGGGVVGDLAGFCAAVYQRGVRWMGVPTTLVAQVDSAYGGKTGVDLPEAKNYVGAYHQPSAVVVDPAVLETLPPLEARRRLRGGGQDRADRGRAAVGARPRGRSRGRRDGVALPAHEAGRGGRGRARRGPAPGAEPGPHDRPCDRGGHLVRALPPWRGRRHRTGRGAAALEPRLAAARGRPAARRAAGCPRRSRAPRWTTCSRTSRATRSGATAECRSSWSKSPGQVSPGHQVGPDELRSAIEEVAG